MYTHRATRLHIVSSTCQGVKSGDIRCTISDIRRSVKYCTMETDRQTERQADRFSVMDKGRVWPYYSYFGWQYRRAKQAEMSRRVVEGFSRQQPWVGVYDTTWFLPHTQWPTARRELHQKRVCGMFVWACSPADVLHLTEPIPVLLRNHAAFSRHLRRVKVHHKWQKHFDLITIMGRLSTLCSCSQERCEIQQKSLKFSCFHLWPHFIFQK